MNYIIMATATGFSLAAFFVGLSTFTGAIAPCHANPNWTLVFLMPAYPVVELTEKFLGQDYALAVGFGGLVVFYSLLSYYPIKYVQQRNVGG